VIFLGDFSFVKIILKNYRVTMTTRPWAVGQNYFASFVASWHPCGKYLVWGLFERHIGTLLLKKSSQAKKLPNPEKMGDQ
jgi:hypothetical protein